MSALGARREKATRTGACKSHPATAPSAASRVAQPGKFAPPSPCGHRRAAAIPRPDRLRAAVQIERSASTKQATQRLQANCQLTAGHRQISFRQVHTLKLWPIEYVWYRGRVGTECPSWIWVGDDHEIAVNLRRALSYRYPVNRIAVQPERYGNVTNRNGRSCPASQHHGRSAEASGEATADGKAGTGGKSCISPGSANLSDVAASQRFSTREDCGA
jgi:hypothetical protein